MSATARPGWRTGTEPGGRKGFDSLALFPRALTVLQVDPLRLKGFSLTHSLTLWKQTRGSRKSAREAVLLQSALVSKT